MNINTFIVSFVFFLLFCIGCRNTEIDDFNPNIRECESLSELGEITVLESSTGFLPYPEETKTIIFSDKDDREYKGKVDFYGFSDLNYVSGSTYSCPIDTTIKLDYNWIAVAKRINFSIEELNIRFLVSVRPLVNNEDYTQRISADILTLFLFYPESASEVNSQLSIIIDPRNYQDPIDYYSDFHDAITIHDRTYNNVYEQEISTNNEFLIYYNNDVGIVGFMNDDSENPIDLKYERVE